VKLQDTEQKKAVNTKLASNATNPSSLNRSLVSDKSPKRKVEAGDKSLLRKVSTTASSPANKLDKVLVNNSPIKKSGNSDSPKSKIGGDKKVNTKSRLEPPKTQTKRKVISYLDQVDELIISTNENYFDLEVEDLVIKKMQDKINKLNEIISSFTEDNKESNSTILNLATKNKELKEENGVLKDRIKRIMNTIEMQESVKFSGILKCLKANPGAIAFDDN